MRSLSTPSGSGYLFIILYFTKRKLIIYVQQADFEPQLNTRHFLVDDEYSKPNELPLKTLVDLRNSKRIVFYNSLASERVQVVTLRVSQYNVEVLKIDSNF